MAAIGDEGRDALLVLVCIPAFIVAFYMIGVATNLNSYHFHRFRFFSFFSFAFFGATAASFFGSIYGHPEPREPIPGLRAVRVSEAINGVAGLAAAVWSVIAFFVLKRLKRYSSRYSPGSLAKQSSRGYFYVLVVDVVLLAGILTSTAFASTVALRSKTECSADS